MTSRERTLAAIVDTFGPAAEGLPSASELGVHTRLLEEVAALGRPSLQRELGRRVDEAEVKALVAGHFARLFEVDLADTAVDRLLGA